MFRFYEFINRINRRFNNSLLHSLKSHLKSIVMKSNMNAQLSQSMANKLLLMYVISKTTISTESHLQILQKVPLMVEINMMKRFKSGFKYSFLMYNHGPVSKEIYHDRDILIDSGMIISDKIVDESHDTKIVLTDEGNRLLNNSMKFLSDYPETLQEIDNWCKKFENKSFDEVKSLVYHEFYNGKSIGAYKKNHPFTHQKALNTFNDCILSGSWVDTLLLIFATNKQQAESMRTFSDYQFDFLKV